VVDTGRVCYDERRTLVASTSESLKLSGACAC
jgi:hypothetical protein